MHSQKQSCWMGFLSICLTGVLLLNQGVQCQYEDFEDATPSPDYIDYNSTFEYSFYSNASNDELDKFLGVGDEDLEEEEDVVDVYDEEGHEVTSTAVTIMTTTERGQEQFSRASSLPVTWVHWSLLLVTLQLVHTL